MIPKYRAWLIAEKKMYPVATLYLSAFAQQVELAGKGFAAAFTIGEEVELMQFTGMQDKNGKPIFEGDILGVDDPTDHSRAVVIFHKGAFKPELVRYPGIFSDDWDWIIIGNRFENTHLLEGYTHAQ